MLDGYLCGVLVQPVLLAPPAWLAHVFDFDGRPLPDEVDAAWLERCTALILRRHSALNRRWSRKAGSIRWCWSSMMTRRRPRRPILRKEKPPPTSIRSRGALMPWVAGFQHAALVFPD